MKTIALVLTCLAIARLHAAPLADWSRDELRLVLGLPSNAKLEIKSLSRSTFPEFGSAASVVRVHEDRAGAPIFEFIEYSSGALWKEGGIRDLTSQLTRDHVAKKQSDPSKQGWVVDRLVDNDGHEILIAVVATQANRAYIGAWGFRRDYDFIVVRIPTLQENLEGRKTEPPEMDVMRKLGKALDARLAKKG